jgi:phage terminase Nu1 subunit (DNA packaging protein)
MGRRATIRRQKTTRASATTRTRRGGAELPTRRELAKLLDVHPQTVVKWEQSGMPIAAPGRKGKATRYRETDVRQWLAARESAAKESGVVDLARDRSRKERAQAILAEQAFSLRARNLLPRDEVEKAWGTEVAAVRTKLLSWPTTLAARVHRVATLEGEPGVERVLQEAVLDVLRELSDARRIVEPDDGGDGAEAHAA